MADITKPSRVILDPSIVFSDEALEWIANPELRPWLAISEALMRRLEDTPSSDAFLPYAEPVPERITQVREALRRNEVMVYSVEQASSEGALSEGARAICERLASGDEPLGDVLADEWAFLTTQSLAAIHERAKYALQAFRRAGGEVFEVAADKMRATLEEVRGQVPDPVLDAMKYVADIPDRIPPWLAFGGTVAGILVPKLGLGLAVAAAVEQGVAVIAGDP